MNTETDKETDPENTQTTLVETVDKEPSNKFIDKLSLEFLLNKTQYQKYLQKTDPQKFTEMQEFSENCSRLSRPMMDMTMRLLQNHKTNDYSQEVQDAFHVYADALIRYLEMKEMTDQIQEEYDENDDENTLFPASMDNDGGHQDDNSSQNYSGVLFHMPNNSGAWWKQSSK